MSTSAEAGTRPGTSSTEPAAPATAGGGNGAGGPQELPGAFAGALVAALRERRPDVADTDDQVPAALALGWYLAALAHPGPVAETAAMARGDLVSLATSEDAAALQFCRSHVEVAFVRLKAIVEQAGLSLPDLQELSACIESARDDARRRAAGDVDAKALSVLSAADFKLGKACGVGRGLLLLTTRPSAQAKLCDHLAADRMGPLTAAIDDLASALPPHAGHSVRASLEEWRASIGLEAVAPEEPETWLLLARQGELWRALLAGEKSGPDMLEIDDYLDAGKRLAGRMRTVATSFLKRFKELAALVVLLFLAGIGVILATESGAVAVAGAGSILASLGLTWRGLGGALGTLAARLERPLWGAELDAAVTQAITLLKRQQGRDTSRQRRSVALSLGYARFARGARP